MSTTKTPTRIYRLDTGRGDRLVRASSRAQAVHHVTASMPVRVATQDDIAQLVAEGVKVETAGEQSPQMQLGAEPQA